MPKSDKLTRREFIRIAAAAAAASGAVACGRGGSPWRFLTVKEAQTLAAACDQIIPPDQNPGAAWAGVVNFIDVQLTGHYKHLQKMYRAGIAGIDESSLALYGRRFVDLHPAEQLQVLKKLEAGEAPGGRWKQLSSRDFFALLVSHTMQGYYGDPRHGGNRERISWTMLGLPYPPIRGFLS